MSFKEEPEEILVVEHSPNAEERIAREVWPEASPASTSPDGLVVFSDSDFDKYFPSNYPLVAYQKKSGGEDERASAAVAAADCLIDGDLVHGDLERDYLPKSQAVRSKEQSRLLNLNGRPQCNAEGQDDEEQDEEADQPSLSEGNLRSRQLVEQVERLLSEMSEAADNSQRLEAAEAIVDDSDAAGARKKKSQKSSEPPVTFREFDVSNVDLNTWSSPYASAPFFF